MTRREGTSKSNFMQSEGNCHDEDVGHRYAFGPLQVRFSQNPLLHFCCGQAPSIDLWKNYPEMVSRRSRKFVFDISKMIQGFGHVLIVGHDSHMGCSNCDFSLLTWVTNALNHATTVSGHRGGSICNESMPRFQFWWHFDNFSVGLDMQILTFFKFRAFSGFEHFSMLIKIWMRTLFEDTAPRIEIVRNQG